MSLAPVVPRQYRAPGDARDKLYDSKAWRYGTRLVVMERDNHTCVLCGAAGNIADHDPPLREQLARGMDPLDPDNARTLCAQCSGREDGKRAHQTRTAAARVNRFMRTVHNG